MDNDVKISIYLDIGVVREYCVDTAERGREHAAAIIKTGYRSTPKDSDDLTWWPPHSIVKVTVSGAGESTKYKDKARAT